MPVLPHAQRRTLKSAHSLTILRRVGLAVGCCWLLAAPSAWAVERAEAHIYVLELVDNGGVILPMIVPLANKSVGESGPSSRPTKAFEALRARSPKAYGATSLRIDSATRATVVLDKIADADQVLSELFWTLGSMGFSEILAPPYVKDALRVDEISYAAHVPIVHVWDLLKFGDQANLLTESFVFVNGRPEGAAEAVRKLQKGDAALKKELADAMGSSAIRPKVAILEAIADGSSRELFRLKADDAALGLGDPSVQVRNLALDAVIAAGSPSGKVKEALESLVENDSDNELKLRAVKALAKAGVSKYNDLLESEKLRTGSAKEALEAVDKLSKSAQVKIAAPALVGALSHSDANVRESAYKGLVSLKQWELLHQALGGDTLSAKMREQIALVLVDNGSPAAQDQALQYLISKGSAAGAIAACQTYGKRGAKTATPTLLEALKNESAEVRGAAADSLSLLKDERALVPLADAAEARARDKDAMMKAAGEIMTTLRLEQVKQFVASKNLTIRQMAIRSLAEFAKGSRPRPDVVALLQEARKDPDPNIKRAAVYALARLQDDGIARDLAEMRKDADAEVRQQVALALGSASSKFSEADAMLEDLVKDTDKRVRIEAIGGLSKRKSSGSVPMLSDMVRQPDPEVKRAVYATLLVLRDSSNADKMRPLFRKGMEFKDSQVRLTCIQALSDKVVVDDIEALRQASFDAAKDVKAAAVTALGVSKLPEAMDALANFFADADMDIRDKAIDALCSIPGGDAKKARQNYLNDATQMPDMPEALKKKADKCAKQ